MLHEPLDTTPASPEQPLGQGEVSRLLAVIAGQIAEADRRHFEALDEMKVRLQQLGTDARSARPQVPQEFVPAFSRIEDALSQLAERISQARAERLHDESFVPAASASDEILPASPATAHGPMALRSAQGAGVATNFNWASDFASKRTDPMAADNFDIIDNGGSGKSSDDAWSTSDAETLMRVYEEAVANPTTELAAAPAAEPTAGAMYGQEIPASVAEPSEPAMPAAAFMLASPPPSASAPAFHLDRQWLEDRFADLNERLQASLDETPVHDKLAALDDRLGQLEEHLGVSLQDVAKRTDVAGLKIVEAHIEEISKHLDETQGQLNRLDTIEAQLNEVVEHLAAQFENHGAPTAAAAVPAEEYQRMANEAAQTVATRFEGMMASSTSAAKNVTGGSDSAIATVRALLESYIGERRDGDEHTALMLDTLQQALIRVLDRIDAMEQSHMPAAFGAAPKIASHNPVERLRDSEPAFSGPEKRQSAAPLVVPAADEYQPPTSLAGNRAPDTVTPPPAAAVQDVEQTPSDNRAGVEKMRQDFVADAVRAKLRASAAKFEGMPAGPLIADIPGARRGGPGLIAPGQKKSRPSVNPKLIVAALALLAVLGAGSVMRHKPSAGAPDAPAAQSAVESSTDAAPPSEPQNQSAAPKATIQTAKPEKPDAAANGFVADGDDGDAVPAPGKISTDEPINPPAGIRLRESTEAVSPRNLMILQHQDALANLSSKLGETAAYKMTPASFMKEMPIPGAPSAVTAAPAPAVSDTPSTAEARSSALDMPPITVGPLSLRLAAAKGDASAEFEAASRLAEGKGTSQNFKEAMRWYQRSAAQGFAQAQYRLGTLFERGLGIKADTGQARSWYQRAAEQGNVKAMHNLAVLSASRQSGSPDYATAAKWFRSAADRDLQDSQYNLGVLYESGLGVEKDAKQAMTWYSLAARAGDVESTRRRDLIKPQLSAPDRAAVADGVANFKAIKVDDPLVNDARAAGEDWKKRMGVEGQG